MEGLPKGSEGRRLRLRVRFKTENKHQKGTSIMARIGKIARMPAAIRNELNRRLENGATGPQVLPWLGCEGAADGELCRTAGQPAESERVAEVVPRFSAISRIIPHFPGAIQGAARF